MNFNLNEIKPVIALLGAGSMGTAIVKRIADSTVLNGLAIQGKIAQESKDKAKKAVTDWLKQNDFWN